MRCALLIYCDEDTAVSDRDRERREAQFTAILDGLRARGVPAIVSPFRSSPASSSADRILLTAARSPLPPPGYHLTPQITPPGGRDQACNPGIEDL